MIKTPYYSPRFSAVTHTHSVRQLLTKGKFPRGVQLGDGNGGRIRLASRRSRDERLAVTREIEQQDICVYSNIANNNNNIIIKLK